MTTAVQSMRRELLTGNDSYDVISDRLVDRARMAHDGSHYLLRPEAVATPRTADEAIQTLIAAARSQQPITFRAGGTSLSGQASTSGMLMDVRRHMSAIEVLNGGELVRCEPGATLRQVNARLASYGRKLGPDPASEIACTIGGIVANNSSGMSSGSTLTAYWTTESMVFALPSGTVVDTADADADRHLRASEPELWEALARIRDRIRRSTKLSRIIRHQFSMKNTMGYSLNAFLDHRTPVDILKHLMIGSEGTLGLMTSVTLRTIPIRAHAATSLLIFENLPTATDALHPLLDAQASSVELLDAASLRVARADPTSPQIMRELEVVDHTALLVEFQGFTSDELNDAAAIGAEAIRSLPVTTPAELTRDSHKRADLWHIRKGLYTAVAGARPPGTTALLEDIVVPTPALTTATIGLQKLLARHGYDDAVIFGHALDANLHFMINPRFDDPAQLANYSRFTDDLVDLILSHDGSLKAEHGTGRMMAPYVRRQFGDELYAIMREVKALCDPHRIMNPGVVINDDATSHLTDLKIVPIIDGAVDNCVECGYCEPGCPSRNTSTTPRQRIALMREIATASPEERRELESAFSYEAVETCAADSLCVRACPVAIDTGKVMKGYRAQSNSALANNVADSIAKNWAPVTRAVRVGIAVAEVVPSALLTLTTRAARTVLSKDLIPLAGDDLPRHGPPRPRANYDADADVVFFPACIGAMFGPAKDGIGSADAFLELCSRAGLRVTIPEGIESMCCGTPFSSKGYNKAYGRMGNTLVESLWKATDGGRLPVVCDASSCTHGIAHLDEVLTDAQRGNYAGIRVVDSVTYLAQTLLPLLPGLDDADKVGSLVLHPTCSTTHLNAGDDLVAVAQAAAVDVTVPTAWGCCGFAGDRGMLHPELTAGATEAESAEVALREYDAYASSNRTCELGIARATGKDYEHIMEILVRQLRRADSRG